MRRAGVTVLMAVVFTVGVRWGSFVAGGSDSYCYLHQAERWASGRLQEPEPLALEAPWPQAPLTFAPAGHLPSPTVAGAIVPICASGLSIVMAVFVVVGGIGAAALVVPLFGAVLAWATFVVGSRFGVRIGVASAGLAACSPVFLYQLVQPMSDVPAAALWMLSVAALTGTHRHKAALGGLAAGAAILVRPNLLPLAVPLACFLLWQPERERRTRIISAAIFSSAVAVACLSVALIQRSYYGSSLSSGYGSLAEIFSAERLFPNLQRYLSWLTEVHTPAWLFAIASPVLLPGALTMLCGALIVVNLACYLPYTVFDDWSYLRFLLPTVPLIVILVVAAIDSVCRRLAPVGARTVLVATALVLAVLWVQEARDRHVFRLQMLEARFERAGRFVEGRLPPNALVITNWHSGSVRFYSGRKTLLWGSLDPAWLNRAIVFVRSRGLEPFLLFESWEEPLFRSRFSAHSDVGRLDWRPAAELASQVRVYRPADRERYLLGLQEPTEYSR